WIGTKGGGVHRFDIKTKKFKHIQYNPSNPNTLSHNEIMAINEDTQGVLWLGTRGGGISQYRKKTNSYTHLKHDPKNPSSLNSDAVTAIYEDSEGIIWIGTEEGGVNQFDPETGEFVHYIHDPFNPNSISDDYIITIFEDHTGTLWFGSYRHGLNRFDKKKKQFIRYIHDPDNPFSLSHDEVGAMFEDKDNNFWIGTADGLNLFNRDIAKFTHFKHDPQNPKSISDNWIYVIHEDQNGILWIGTKGGGLNKFNPKTENFIHYTVQDGLPSNVINGIIEDAKKNLWISTNKGLCQFHPWTGTFKTYDVDDGLQSHEFRPRSFFKNKKGEMFFGGISGFNRFFPTQITDNPYLPTVVLTDFKKFGKSIPLDRPISYIPNMTLSYKDNFFTFEFSGLEYTNPEKILYAYKLDGFDDNWIQIGNRREASYTNLDGGKYTFRVKAANNDGVWNEKGLNVNIRIIPPPWKTWWAYLLYLLLFSGLIFFYIQARTRNYKREIVAQEKSKILLKKKVKERTIEISTANEQLRLEITERIQTEKELLQTKDALEIANQKLLRLATVDGLTQVANRRRFDDYLRKEWTRANRDQHSLSLILCDIDHFKLYNDTYGHQAGDECLKKVACALCSVAKRSTDMVARYGGEEFAIILPNTYKNAAFHIAQALLKEIYGLKIVHEKSLVSEYITISAGVVSAIPVKHSSEKDLIKQADEALYKAKSKGRNQVVAKSNIT
ncbi:MAG: diguanylate cyclase, partial [Desulfobacteraceae bacterium]|nr:diguanylate cyclase [Desulfobacteraceae bacterium]